MSHAISSRGRRRCRARLEVSRRRQTQTHNIQTLWDIFGFVFVSDTRTPDRSRRQSTRRTSNHDALDGESPLLLHLGHSSVVPQTTPRCNFQWQNTNIGSIIGGVRVSKGNHHVLKSSTCLSIISAPLQCYLQRWPPSEAKQEGAPPLSWLAQHAFLGSFSVPHFRWHHS